MIPSSAGVTSTEAPSIGSSESDVTVPVTVTSTSIGSSDSDEPPESHEAKMGVARIARRTQTRKIVRRIGERKTRSQKKSRRFRCRWSAIKTESLKSGSLRCDRAGSFQVSFAEVESESYVQVQNPVVPSFRLMARFLFSSVPSLGSSRPRAHHGKTQNRAGVGARKLWARRHERASHRDRRPL